jgi:hypothetical protein
MHGIRQGEPPGGGPGAAVVTDLGLDLVAAGGRAGATVAAQRYAQHERHPPFLAHAGLRGQPAPLLSGVSPTRF